MSAYVPASPYDVSAIAQAFHEEYERQAAQLDWETQRASRVSWHEVPDANRLTMLATVRALVDAGVIAIPPISPASAGVSGHAPEEKP